MPKGHGEGSKATQFKLTTKSLWDRFHESYIPEPNSGCWLWIKGVDSKGYGRLLLQPRGKMVLAHRVSYRLHYGDTEKFILHQCDNSYCVNPEHLYAGTQADNVRDRTVRNRAADQRGEKGSNVKLTDAQALAIRSDIRSQRIIALAYGISQTSVSNIKHRKTWRHI